MQVKRGLFLGAERLSYWSGLAYAYQRACHVNGCIILMYHSVADGRSSEWIDPRNAIQPGVFERQMSFLHRCRRVVAMSELIEAVRSGRELPAGTVVLTFDDGYRDNLHLVAPILDRFRFPALLYLPTEYVNSGRNQWIDELYTMFEHRTQSTLEVSGATVALRRGGSTAAAEAYRVLTGKMIVADLQGRERILNRVAEQLRPTSTPPRLTLSWDEVRELIRRYPNFEIGAHTADHCDLCAHADQAESQIRRSISDIERELGFRPVHFSFPYGRYNERSQQAARNCGFLSAVVSGSNPLIGMHANPYSLSRIAAPVSSTLFRFYTSGAYPGLPGRLAGRV